MRNNLGTFVATGILAISIPLAAANAQEHEPEPQFVCTAEQVLGPFLGSLLPATFSPEVAALFGVDPDECVTPVEQF